MKHAVLAASFALFASSLSAYGAVGASSAATTLGIDAGIDFLGDSGGTHFNLGVNGTYPILPPFFVGLDFNYIDRGTISSSTISTTGSLYLLTASANLDTSGYIPGSYVGFLFGPGWNHTGTTIGGVSTSNTDSVFYVGPRVGYDYPLSNRVSIGGQANWFLTPSNGAPNILSVLALLKLWI